jgi:hypothetical protein
LATLPPLGLLLLLLLLLLLVTVLFLLIPLVRLVLGRRLLAGEFNSGVEVGV